MKLSAIVVAAAAVAGCRGLPLQRPEVRLVWAEQAVIPRWSNWSAPLARRLIARYGPPDEVRHDRLIWRDAGPWTEIVVRDEPPYYVPGAGPDNLTQTVAYDVPADRVGRLRPLRRKLRVSLKQGQLTAHGTSEAKNLLALNIAHDLLTGRREPEHALAFYDRTLALAAAGKASPYMGRLLFPVQRRGGRP